MTDAINSWNNVYSSIPDFKKYNEQFSLNRLVGLALVPMMGLILSKDSQPLLNRACLLSFVGLTAVKGSIALGAYVQGKVWERTDTFARLQNELSVWNTLVPPSDPTITDCHKRHRQMQNKIWNSFPRSGFIWRSKVNPSKAPMPKPEPYTLEKLEADCEQWMNDTLAIAKAVREDLKKWSESGRFTLNNRRLTNGDLLEVQPPNGEDPAFNFPWLYRGFFSLPEAYRYIFDLPDCISEFEGRDEKKAEDEFAKTYPASNRQVHEGWKEKFFTTGTKQYEWRQKYNEAMEAIFAQTGGIDKIPDERFQKWGALHKDNDDKFNNWPGGKPT